MIEQKIKKRYKSTLLAYNRNIDIVGVIGSSPTNPTPRSLTDQGSGVFF